MNNLLQSKRTLIVGILNVTPDSFSDGGLFFDKEKAIAHAKKMIQEGADIIDIGGESTKPGSDSVSEEEELKRVKPIIERLRKETAVPISIDTYKPRVAEECLKMGAQIVNDVTGLRNEEMIQVVARYKAPVVLMHMKGVPKSMQEDPTYTDVVQEIKEFFKERIWAAREAGIQDIILDPGIGFGKTLKHNLQILKRLGEFKELGYPILVGTSRKSFIGKLTGDSSVEDRLEGSIASMVIAIMNGATLVRVHDVKPAKRAIQISDAIKYAG
ncbi:MAG: dihydropteroate synthase [bacterium]|nr:dihydropteroate synthase [bacterium]